MRESPPYYHYEEDSVSENNEKVVSVDMLSLPPPQDNVLNNNEAVHPIETMLESPGWMRNDGSSSAGEKTNDEDDDDDDFRKELERLNLSEEQVSREIREAIEHFHATTINKTMTANSVKKHRYNKGKHKQNIVRISDVEHIDRIEQDSRELGNDSCPSDEACVGIVDQCQENIDQREAEEEAIQQSHIRDSIEDQLQQSLYMSSTETSSVMQVELSTGEDDEKRSFTSKKETSKKNTDGFIDRTDEFSVAMSEWKIISHFDVERADIFEAENFWDHGLWRTPIIDQANVRSGATPGDCQRQSEAINETFVNSSSELKNFNDDCDVDRHKSDPRFRRHEALEKLYLPHLISPPDNLIIEHATETRSEAVADGNVLTPRKEIESKYWINQSEASLDVLEGHWTKCASIHKRTHENARDPSTLEKVSDAEADLVTIKCRDYRLRVWVIVSLHFILAAIGFVLLSRYLKSSRLSTDKQFPTPEHVLCSTSELLNEGDLVFGTTYSDTVDEAFCMEEKISGVWYTVVGNGRQMSVTAAGNHWHAPNLYLLSGQCGDLLCIGKSGDQSAIDGSLSLLWHSEPEEQYKILVHGEPSMTNYSLLLEESPSSNEECISATSVILGEENSDVSISSYTIPSRQNTTCTSGRTIGSSSWFVVPSNQKFMTASICHDNDRPQQRDRFRLDLLTGGCGETRCTVRNNGLSTGSELLLGVEWIASAEEHYSLLVSSMEADSIPFVLCLTQREVGKSCPAAVDADFLSNKDGRAKVEGSVSPWPHTDFDSDQFESLSHYGCYKNLIPYNSNWFVLEGTGQNVAASVCVNETSNGTISFDVFSGEDCTTLKCAHKGISVTCGSSRPEFLSLQTVLGRRYYIVVYGEDRGSRGTFTLDLYSVQPSHELPSYVDMNPISKQRDRVSTRIWVYVSIGSLCTVFALFAWRWRRLK